MNRISLIIRQKIFSIIFIVIAVLGGIVIFWYINNLKAKISEDIGYRQIFIAKTDIKQGEEILKELIEEQKISENIFSEKFMVDESKILGKKVTDDILEGEIITKDKLDGIESNNDVNLSFSSYIPSDLRAVSVPVNYYGEGPLVKIGDRVDIISTYYEQESGNLFSDTILYEKEIILIGNNLDRNYSETGNDGNEFLLDSMFGGDINFRNYEELLIITFYLKPSEVEEIFLALERGLLNLSICPKNYSFNR